MTATRLFSWTGVDVPVIGQGTWMLEDDSAVAVLRRGLDVGMTHIDTAEMYGNGRTEEIVGKAIAGRRAEVFLVSKVLPSNASYDGTLRACERSLRRLGTDYLDLYLLHWPGSYPIADTMRALEKLVADGAVRFIGVSNFDTPELQDAERALRHERLACNQVLYHLRDRGIERRLMPYCASRQIAVVAYSPFGRTKPPESKVLEEIATRHGRTVRQVVLRFLARDANVFTIPKTSHLERVDENAVAANWDFDPAEIAAIDRAFPAPDHDVPLGML